MKKNTLTYLIIITLLILTINFVNAQDVAIVGFNSNTNDGYTLVALKDIPASQNIFVTDASYDSATNSFDGASSVNEGTIKITRTGTWSKGTIIEVEETGTSTFTVLSSTNGPLSPNAQIVYAGDGFSISNEGLSVFASSNNSDPDNNVDEIYSFIVDNAAGSVDPNPNLDIDCPCSTEFVTLDFASTAIDFVEFKPSLRSGSVSYADFINLSNWDTADVNTNLDLTEFANLTFGGGGTLSISDNTIDMSSIKLYPNPANSHISLINSNQQSIEKCMIYDVRGRLISIIDLKENSNIKSIDISFLQNGMYFFSIYGKYGQTTRQFIKK